MVRLFYDYVHPKGAVLKIIMEKVYDIHVHYLFDIPLKEKVDIFREEFAATGTEKCCFLSVPHHAHNDEVDFDEVHNIKGLYLKHAFSPKAHAFAGLVHPQEHTDKKAVAEFFLAQVKEYMCVGYDGIKMLEGYPSLMKAWNLPLDDCVYDLFYGYMEENGYPILIHIANPKENWDISQASEYAIQAGRVYDESYPTKEEITAQVFRVMEKYPNLKLILAHFGFMSYDIEEAERFMEYPNAYFDITPGGEQLLNMGKKWEKWLPFWERYQDKILYGTDFYAFPKNESWEITFQRRPKFIREFLETQEEHEYLDEKFCGIMLGKKIRDKIYRENFKRLLGEPKGIDKEYLLQTAKKLLQVSDKKTAYAEDDLQYILKECDCNK